MTTVTLTVTDGGGLTATDTFTVTVGTANTPPTISDVANQTTPVSTATAALAVTVSDLETGLGALVLTGTSSNTTLVPNASIAFGGSGANRTVTVTPAAGQSGVTTVTLTVTDGGGLTATDTFTVTVGAPSSLSYYLAEGATGAFFDLDIIIANPNTQDAPVAMTFLDKFGNTYSLNFTLPAKRSRTVAVEKEVPALASTDVSTIVTSTTGLPLVVERSLFWDATYYGGHTGNAVDGPKSTWYFGEGFQAAPGVFDTFILLANANPASAVVTLTFLREGDTPVQATKTVGGLSRANFWAAELPAQLIGKSFSTVVTSTIPIIAERAITSGAPCSTAGTRVRGSRGRRRSGSMPRAVPGRSSTLTS